MSTTLTVRTGDRLRAALVARSEAEGIGLSELVRRILEDAIAERPLLERGGHLRGRLDLGSEGAADEDDWLHQIHQNNWRL